MTPEEILLTLKRDEDNPNVEVASHEKVARLIRKTVVDKVGLPESEFIINDIFGSKNLKEIKLSKIILKLGLGIGVMGLSKVSTMNLGKYGDFLIMDGNIKEIINKCVIEKI